MSYSGRISIGSWCVNPFQAVLGKHTTFSSIDMAHGMAYEEDKKKIESQEKKNETEKGK